MNGIGRTVRTAARRVAGVALGALVLATSLEAQTSAGSPATGGTPAWLRARLNDRLDPATRAAVERLIDSTLAAGVPAEPLVDKALEGASKRAPREAILRVLRGLATDLQLARRALGAGALPDELAAAASALRVGVEDDALRTLRRVREGQPLVVPLGVLTDLVASGVPADAAARSVVALTRVGIADEQLVAFRREVERDIGIGAPPAAAVALRTSTLSANVAPGAGGGTGARPTGGEKRRP